MEYVWEITGQMFIDILFHKIMSPVFKYIGGALKKLMKALFLLYGLSVYSQNTDTLKIKNILLDSTGKLKWSILMTNSPLYYQVETLVSNEWQNLYSVNGARALVKISSNASSSWWMQESEKIKFHHGLNKIRVRVTAPYVAMSEEVQYYYKYYELNNHHPIVTRKKIAFNQDVSYAIYNKKYKQVLKGVGQEVDISSLKRGKYYLQSDTTSSWGLIIKKSMKGPDSYFYFNTP